MNERISRSNQGTARVGLMWTVVMIVITLASIAFGYFAYDEQSKAVAAMEEAIAAREKADERVVEKDLQIVEISKKLGFQGDSLTQPANPEVAAAELSRLRETFTDVPSDVTSFEKALPFVIAQYNAETTRTGQLQSRITSLDSELSSARSQRTNDIAEKDKTISDLRNELATERSNAEDREENLNSRLADAEQAADQLDRRLRDAEAASEEQVRGLNQEIADLRLRNQTLSAKLDIRLQRARVEEPDAKVLTVSSSLPLAWIDIGSDDRLAPGMGFEVRANRLSGTKTKARAVVRRVEANRAEIELFGLVDKYDPVVEGDVLFSPIYDPVGERTAVLAGRFSGTWDAQRLTMVLADMGIRVQDKLTGTTDMLITGGEIYYDELGEPLEEPIDPSQLPVYAEALSANITIVPISTLRDYLPAVQ
ncbi:MAG: hypothetical protein R3F34_01670 [Planctomycetota bacterium]